MDRCALFVDASYVLADGAMAVHGTRRRESVSWDYPGLLQLLGNLAMERTNLPLLRCYWYEATVEGRRSADHDTLADLPGVKLRVAKMRPGRREGVEGEIHRDLTTLARNKAVSDAMVVSGEEDLAQVIADVQDMGMRVTLLQIVGEGSQAVSRTLRQECDDIVEISAAHLRPYVELITGAEPPRSDESDGTLVALRPALNGNGNGYFATQGQQAYPQPQAVPAAGQQQTDPLPAPPAAEYQPHAEPPQRVAAEVVQADGLPPEHTDGAMAADYSSLMPDFNANVDYHTSVDFGSIDYGSAPDYGRAAEYASFPDRPAAPVPPVPPVPSAQPPGMREDLYAAPVVLPAPAEYLPAEREQPPGRPQHDMGPAAYAPGVAREQYQRDGMLRDHGAPDADDRQPVPVPVPVGSAQVRRLPTRGAVTAGPNPAQAPSGLVPGRIPDGEPGMAQSLPGQSLPAQPPSVPQFTAEPTAAQPLSGGFQGGQPIAPVLPMDPNGAGYAGARGNGPDGPRPFIPGVPGGPVGLSGNMGAGQQGNSGPQHALGPVGPGQQPPAMAPQAPIPAGPGTGAPSGPIGLVGPAGYPGAAQPGPSLADAVQSAHEEGQAFGESVARDAPALWLEAVLARKPRMPSDLEARLLQGSALPIDFLLHDEVRHALRRGFWDALERSRR
ncbi:NYN domain-containing protein [Trebonia kvetii]|uniref:NYN domain-containing protein n=1 Tax=Trebonia kvetii TaxID=2480626 RepID=UPI001FE920DA|nr:NYN domain-containing protein [Trebonia kvetii]